jgi:hypothetical protein
MLKIDCSKKRGRLNLPKPKLEKLQRKERREGKKLI